MKAEIISVGTELLIGSILNTNARFLAKKLAENAVDVYHQTTVGDNVGRIAQCFETAAARADLVVVSGGLGPTEDDVTMQALGGYLGRTLVFHQKTHDGITHRMKSRGYKMTRMIDRQCYLPEGATVLQNAFGTAPAVICRDKDKKVFLVLPGPPRELEPLFGRALPLLLRQSGITQGHFVTRGVKIAGLTEAEVAQKIGNILKMKPPLTAGIYARPGEVEIKIMAKDASRTRAKKMADGVEKYLRKRLGSDVFGVDQETLAGAAGKILKRKKMTLATAESCTGGLLSSRITDVPGSSDYYKGGLITYADKAKRDLLYVPEVLLKKKGAVSADVAVWMAKGVRQALGATWGIGITGIAGPSGGSARKPVGTVYLAFSGPKQVRVFKFLFYGTRAEIRSRAANKALDILRRALQTSLKAVRSLRP